MEPLLDFNRSHHRGGALPGPDRGGARTTRQRGRSRTRSRPDRMGEPMTAVESDTCARKRSKMSNTLDHDGPVALLCGHTVRHAPARR
jgi:hypothetical protein